MQTSTRKKKGYKGKSSPIFEAVQSGIKRAKQFKTDFAIVPYPDQTSINYLIACGYRYTSYSNNRAIVRFQ